MPTKIIDASPTKELFISMLIRDIELTSAIVDLVDNSVDGAKRMRGKKDFKGLKVSISSTPGQFTISDNCGGVPVDVARKYAFRFGRPLGALSTPRSIGQFGVGMKRALFKLGGRFDIVSRAETSEFELEVDVEKWKRKPAWQFEFKTMAAHPASVTPTSQRGTVITVTKLHDQVRDEFALEHFEARLALEVESRQQESLEAGLTILVNDKELKVRPSELLASSRLKPGYKELVFKEAGKKSMHIRIYAGIGPSVPAEAGWYVYCNGRMILEADKSNVTGWGEGGESTIPRYHNQFARFRGYTFFDCDDASLLPWNTTKTGVDADSPRFKSVRQEMISLWRPVITFLNKLKDEETQEDQPLEEAIEAAKPARVAYVSTAATFTFPKTRPANAPKVRRIAYSKPIDQIERAKEALDVTTATEVGELTFDYFYRKECKDA